MQNILEVNKLEKVFTHRRWPWSTPQITRAVNGISFQMHSREILGLLGPNGAGKTTTIQMLLDLLTPTKGTIKYFGQDLAQHKNVRQHIAYASGYMKLPSSLTVMQALTMYGRLYGMSTQQINIKSRELIQSLNIGHLCNQKTSTLSAGQTTVVLVARALLVQPKILLLDEPTAALDPENAVTVRSIITEQNKQHGVSVLFTSHNMPEVADLCDRILVLKSGNIVADNTPEKLAATVRNTRVQLVLTCKQEVWQNFARQENIIYKYEGHHTEIVTDEHEIADLLAKLAHVGINYSQIAIEKPTLEDYFLLMARGQEQKHA